MALLDSVSHCIAEFLQVIFLTMALGGKPYRRCRVCLTTLLTVPLEVEVLC